MERCSKTPRHASLLRKFPVHSLPTLRGGMEGGNCYFPCEIPPSPPFKRGEQGDFRRQRFRASYNWSRQRGNEYSGFAGSKSISRSPGFKRRSR